MESLKPEFETFRRLITETYPTGIVSIVSDTWDFWQVITEFLPRLKDEIMARDGKVVIRPDSGDPVKIICGDPYLSDESLPAFRGAIECLWETFGGTMNEKGYRELDSHIGLIYGDSITLERCNDICRLLELKQLASTNVVLGIGSFTYQYVTEIAIFKDPKTDNGMKKSAKGFLAVKDGKLIDGLTQQEALEQTELLPVFRDGNLLSDQTLAEIRDRIQT
jgi:nicotinamide phosphoribosyltransferase